MSLHALAGHMATKGRGGDSMLIHMTPEEVQSLQALALKNGGTLTINPDTGLPEANFLKQLLPIAAGFALGPAGFGLMSAGMAGLTVGGITTLATGSLSRGLMAGLGAYGGAGLGASLSTAGEGALAAGDIAAQQAAKTFPALAEGAGAGEIAKYAADAGAANAAALSKAGEAGFGAKMSAGFGQMASNPGMYGREIMSGLAAISPMLADEGVGTTTQRPEVDTGTIRNFTFDPYRQTYESAGNYPASEYTGMAQGGIVALAAGGTPPITRDQLNAIYMQELGRPLGAEGEQYFLGGGTTLTSADAIRTAVQASPEARNFSTAGINTLNAPEAFSNVYRNVLGRDPDPVGLEYWTGQLKSGDRSAQEVFDSFTGTAQRDLGQSGESQFFKPSVSLTDAIKPYEGYSSADKSNIADEWVRNTLGREVTDADRQQNWYKSAVGSDLTGASAAQDIFGQFQNYATDYARTAGKNFDPNAGLFAASQLRPLGVRDPISLEDAAVVPPGVRDPIFLEDAAVVPPGASGAGITTINPNDTITTTPNIPGRPAGGFTGMGQVRDAYTEGGGSLGYVNPAPRSMEEFNTRFNRQTGDSLAAYEYLMGQGAYPTKSGVGEIMRPYSEATLGIPAREGRPNQKFIFQDGRYVENPNYRPLSFNTKGERFAGLTSGEVLKGVQGLEGSALFDFVSQNNISAAQLAAALGISIAEAQARINAGKASLSAAEKAAAEKAVADSASSNRNGDGYIGGDSDFSFGGGQAPAPVIDQRGFYDPNNPTQGQVDGGYNSSEGYDGGRNSNVSVGDPIGRSDIQGTKIAKGGLLGLAQGGMAGMGSTPRYNLGGYSDGGRLLRGPGDGVSDSIPAMIGDRQPARLADGEFVVPARVVSELGNGSTEAGSRQLYAMMDRVQKARSKTTGKNRVAANTRADKFLPA